MVKNLPANAGDIRDVGLISGLGRSPGGEHGNPLQYSCLENPMDRGVWLATVRAIGLQSRTQLKRLCTHTHTRRPRTLMGNAGDSLPLALLWLKGQLQRKTYLWHELNFSSWGALFFELSFVEDYPHCSSQKGPLREKCYHGQNTFNSLTGKKNSFWSTDG